MGSLSRARAWENSQLVLRAPGRARDISNARGTCARAGGGTRHIMHINRNATQIAREPRLTNSTRIQANASKRAGENAGWGEGEKLVTRV